MKVLKNSNDKKKSKNNTKFSIKKKMNSGCNEARIFRICKNGGDLKQLAHDCGQEVYGVTQSSPFKHIGTKYMTCSRLFSLMVANQGERLFATADEKMKSFLEHVIGVNPEKETELFLFQADIVDCLFALIYLLETDDLAEKICINLQPLVNALAFPDKELQFHDFCVTWVYSNRQQKYLFNVPGTDISAFVSSIKKCLLQKRFWICLLVLQSKALNQKIIAHCSALLYDSETGLFERFDSYGSTNPIFDTVRLDEKLLTIAKQLPNFKEMISPPNMSSFDRKGLQYLQENSNTKLEGDPIGFCIPWSILYIQARLSCPLQDPESIPDLLKYWAASDSRSLSSVIRRFTRKIEALKTEVYSQFVFENPNANMISNDYMYRTILKTFEKHLNK